MKNLLIFLSLIPGLLLGQGRAVVGSGPDVTIQGANYPNTFDSRINLGLPLITQSYPYNETVGNSLFIWNVPNVANPGEWITLKGNFPADAIPCLLVGNGSRYIKLEVASQMTNYVVCKIPQPLTLGLYRIFVKSGVFRSSEHYINKADPYASDSPISYPGGPLRLNGRSMFFDNVVPTIRLESQTTGTSLSASYVPGESHFYELRIRIPLEAIVGQKYNVWVNNGLNNEFGETKLDSAITIVAAQKDTLNLQVGWSAKLVTSNTYNLVTDSRLPVKVVKDSSVNNTSNIQSCLDKISSLGGGFAVLPSGIYKCTGTGTTGLTIPTNVIFTGVKRDSTRLLWRGFTQKFLYSDGGSNGVGVRNMTIQYILDGTPLDSSNTANTLQFRGSYPFMQNVSVRTGRRGNQIYFESTTGGGVFNCNIHEMYADSALAKGLGALNVRFAKWLTIRGNTITFTSNALAHFQSPFSFTTDNTFYRDEQYFPTKKLTGHDVATAGSYRSSFNYNIIKTINGPLLRYKLPAGQVDENGFNTKVWHNDKESFNFENSESWLTTSLVRSATPTSITDASQNWTGQFSGSVPYITITQGTGVSQTRRVTGRNANTIFFTPALDVVPSAGSRYVVFNADLDRNIFYKNGLYNQQRGFTAYGSHIIKTDFSWNTLYNSGSIDVMANHFNYKTGVDSTARLSIQYGVQIRNNKLDCSTDPYNGCSINTSPTQHIIRESWGTHILAPVIIGNTIIGSIPNKRSVVDDTYPTGYNIGLTFHRQTKRNNIPVYDNYLTVSQPNGTAQDILGAVVQNNACYNCDNAVYTGYHVVGTVIDNMKTGSTSPTNLVKEIYYESDRGIYWTIGSYNTVIRQP